MSTLDPLQMKVAESKEELEFLTQQAAVEVQFDSKAAEQAYQEADWRLHLQICEVMGMTAGADRPDGLVHMIEDWWPNRARYMEVDVTAFGLAQMKALRALLHGEFEDWAILVSIYRGFTSDVANDTPEYIGGVAIYATRTIVQREVLGLVDVPTNRRWN
jgi:hypothetical protein